MIEVMIVVVIIGIPAAIAVPDFLSMKTRDKKASIKNIMHILQLVIENFNTGAAGQPYRLEPGNVLYTGYDSSGGIINPSDITANYTICVDNKKADVPILIKALM